MCLYSESLLVSPGSTALFVPKITRQPFPRASELLLTPMTSLLNKLPPLFAILGPRNRNGGRVCSRLSRSNCYQVVFPREQIKSQRLALSWGKSYRGTVSWDVSTQLSQELEDEYFGAAGQYGQSIRASLHSTNFQPSGHGLGLLFSASQWWWVLFSPGQWGKEKGENEKAFPRLLSVPGALPSSSLDRYFGPS